MPAFRSSTFCQLKLRSVVFSGLHRFGYSSAASILTTTPDIAAYAKILTGGLLPLSATLASKSIFEAFLSDRKVDALLHGHSYTANPVGCAVALKAIDIVEAHEKRKGWSEEKKMWGVTGGPKSEGKEQFEVDSGPWSFWDPHFLQEVSRFKGVRASMAMGSVLAIELEDGQGGTYTVEFHSSDFDRLESRILIPCGVELPYRSEKRGDNVSLWGVCAVSDPF